MKIGTHNGVFHADDVVAVATLILTALFAGAEIIRSRDPQVLGDCHVLVDVGGELNGETRFDHHQRGGAGTRENGVPYASAGLVWSVFGVELCNGSAEVASIVERNFIAPVDAADTGIELAEAKGEVIPLTFSGVISSLNPSWQETDQDFDAAFGQAVEVAKTFLQREIIRARGVVEARDAVLSAMAGAEDPRLVVLDRFCPWVETVVECAETLFVAFPSPTGDWRLQAVPPTADSFDKRKPLPEEWAGLRGEELAELTGVSNAVFCHPGRFICGAGSKEGILALAKLALAD